MNKLPTSRIASFALYLLAAIWFAGAVVGCREASPPAAKVSSVKLAKSMSDIEMLLSAGMNTNEIVARIGSPDWRDSEEGDAIWTYGLTPFAWDGREDYQVVGINLFITNGCLSYWGGIYAPKEATSPVIKNDEVISHGSSNLLSLSFYVVHDSTVESGRFVDTPKFPKLGFISAQPDFKLDRIGEIRLEEREVTQGGTNQNVWGLSFNLDPQDAELFGSFTMKNLGNQVAFMLGAEIVIAPIITEPILAGTLEIQFQDRSRMEEIRDKLYAVLKPKE